MRWWRSTLTEAYVHSSTHANSIGTHAQKCSCINIHSATYFILFFKTTTNHNLLRLAQKLTEKKPHKIIIHSSNQKSEIIKTNLKTKILKVNFGSDFQHNYSLYESCVFWYQQMCCCRIYLVLSSCCSLNTQSVKKISVRL